MTATAQRKWSFFLTFAGKSNPSSPADYNYVHITWVSLHRWEGTHQPGIIALLFTTRLYTMSQHNGSLGTRIPIFSDRLAYCSKTLLWPRCQTQCKNSRNSTSCVIIEKKDGVREMNSKAQRGTALRKLLGTDGIVLFSFYGCLHPLTSGSITSLLSLPVWSHCHLFFYTLISPGP